MKRISSMILFASIALLLTAKTGINLWQTSHPATAMAASLPKAPARSETQIAQTPVSSKASASIAEPSAADSWAMLETFVIPEANAESSPNAADPAIEDKTLTSLRQYKSELEQRAKNLDQREQSLQQAEDKLKQRITELEQLEASIQQRLLDESKVKSKKIKRLTAVYEGMKADRAAAVIAKMELATVVKIFLIMDEKKVGKILSFLPPEKAVVISQALTHQISALK